MTVMVRGSYAGSRYSSPQETFGLPHPLQPHHGGGGRERGGEGSGCGLLRGGWNGATAPSSSLSAVAAAAARANGGLRGILVAEGTPRSSDSHSGSDSKRRVSFGVTSDAESRPRPSDKVGRRAGALASTTSHVHEFTSMGMGSESLQQLGFNMAECAL
jgi:hypothetical protein